MKLILFLTNEKVYMWDFFKVGGGKFFDFSSEWKKKQKREKRIRKEKGIRRVKQNKDQRRGRKDCYCEREE